MAEKPVHEELEQRIKQLESATTESVLAADDIFRMVAENIEQAIYVMSSDYSKITYANPASGRLYGIPVETLYSDPMSWARHIHPDDFERIAADIEEQATDGMEGHQRQEFRIMHPERGEVWVSSTIYPARDNPGYLIGMSTDITERKQADEALLKGERLHHEAQRVARLGHWELNLLSGTPVWSEEIFHIFGLDPVSSEPSFAAHEKIIHVGDWLLLSRSIMELRTRGNPLDIEFRVLHLGGEIRWMHAIGSAERDEAGNVTRIFGTAQDITERKRIENNLEESRELLSSHLERTPVGAISWNMDFEVVEWNHAAESIFGYSKAEALGKNGVELLVPEETEVEVDDIFQALLGQEGGTHNINENVTKDGARIACDWYNTTLTDSDGQTTGIASFVLDVTARIQAERELQDEKDTAQGYLDIAGVVFVAIDREGMVTLINQKGCDILGYDEDEIVGKNWFDNYIPQWLKEDLIPVSRKLLDGDPESEEYHENAILTKAGEERVIAWNNTVVRDDEGNIIGLLSSGEDVTDKKNAEDALLKSEAQLQQAQKVEAIGTLAGGIAHDFNNILGIIMGNTELAIDDVPDWNPAKECLKEIRSASLRARDIVRQILSFSRHTLFERKPMRLSPVIEETLSLMRATIPSSISIHKDLSAQADVLVADQAQMSQILMNLCTNAYQAMGDGGALKVSLDDITIDDSTVPGLASGSYIRLNVGDTGQGIDPENIDKIFDPYFTTKKVGEGTGMGLAVIRGILTNHGGAITVDSQLGEGTTFHVYLPLADEDVAQKIDMPESLPSGTERILFVDDEESLVRAYSRALSDLGYDVIPLTSSREALEAFKKEPGKIDLVITDMTMPEMTGDQLARELQKIRSDIPIIICTGHSEKVAEKTVKDLGIAGFVLKPVVKRNIALTVRRALDSQT